MGSLVGAWLSSQPSLHVTLLGRSGRAADSALLQRLYLSPTPVVLLRCDVSCREEAAAAVADESLGPHADTYGPCGVVHAGGLLSDGAITSQMAAGVRAVFAPKVATLPSHAQVFTCDLQWAS